jgi:hypothetical protein
MTVAEPDFRPDFQAGLRVELLRMARLRLRLHQATERYLRTENRALEARVQALTTDDTPCSDCGHPIGDHRRYTGLAQVLCADCERANFGH